jgi:hypothetical protein
MALDHEAKIKGKKRTRDIPLNQKAKIPEILEEWGY